MYLGVPRALDHRFYLGVTVLLLCFVQISSAQLVNTDHLLLGYPRGVDGALPGSMPAAGSTGAIVTGALSTQELPEAPLAVVSVDSISPLHPVVREMFQTLPPEKDEEVQFPGTRNPVDGVDLSAAFATFQRGLVQRSRRGKDRRPTDAINDDDPLVGEGYHWRGLIAQSLFFNVIENSFRAASDDQIRTLLASKPFWHDYVASIRQFNMRRWNDGDDFLVNYVGHPMQGAVSGFIEVQNDPAGREQEIGATRAYWMSRFKAFLWATAYSTHSEISPLGEAGIGNEGGWTYPIHCRTRCTEPGTYKKSTNNTGWVDFIITPTLGSVWLLAEDTLDRFVSDRIQGGNRSRILPKIVRGSLNPSRTMANALRFKAPWYRDFQHSSDVEGSYGVHVLPSDESVREVQNVRRFALMPYFIALPLGTAAHPCTVCVQNPGVGVEAEFSLTRWLAVSFAASKQPAVVDRPSTINRSMVRVDLGIRLMYERPNNTLSLAVRPGLLTEPAPIPPASERIQISHAQTESNITHAATTIMLSNDYKLSSLVALRSSFGVVIVRDRNAVQTSPGIGDVPYLSWLSHDSYTNRSTWTCEMGPVFRF
jgi:hypothetical protein